MGIKEKLDLLNEKADKFADGRRLYCLILSLTEKIFFGNTAEDIFSLRLFEKNFHERRKYLTQRDAVNLSDINGKNIQLFADKEKFNNAFKDKLGREYLYAAHSAYDEFERFCNNHPEFLVKTNWTSQGSGIYKYRIDKDSDLKGLFKKFSEEYVMLEEIIIQHKEMSRLNPSSVNTIRVATLYHNNKVNIIATALRIGNGGLVDNTHAGGIIAAVDIETGIVKSLGYNEAGDEYLKHPGTGAIIPGFQIPNWDKAISLVTEAAQRVPQHKWIGWDVAITEDGAVLIEGNHDQGTIQYGDKGQKPDVKAILKS